MEKPKILCSSEFPSQILDKIAELFKRFTSKSVNLVNWVRMSWMAYMDFFSENKYIINIDEVVPLTL